jgi:hypothetical protein
VFTHVTRLVRSKGPWRDLGVLHDIERGLREQGKTAVFILLSTEVSRRRSCDISNMESKYGWDVVVRKYLLNDLSRVTQKQAGAKKYLKAS